MTEVKYNAYELVDKLDFSSPEAFYRSYSSMTNESFYEVMNNTDIGLSIYDFYEKISVPIYDNIISILNSF